MFSANIKKKKKIHRCRPHLYFPVVDVCVREISSDNSNIQESSYPRSDSVEAIFTSGVSDVAVFPYRRFSLASSYYIFSLILLSHALCIQRSYYLHFFTTPCPVSSKCCMRNVQSVATMVCSVIVIYTRKTTCTCANRF